MTSDEARGWTRLALATLLVIPGLACGPEPDGPACPDPGTCQEARTAQAEAIGGGPAVQVLPHSALMLRPLWAMHPDDAFLPMTGRIVVRNVGTGSPDGAEPLLLGTPGLDGGRKRIWTVTPGANTLASDFSIEAIEGAHLVESGLAPNADQAITFQVTLRSQLPGPKSAVLTLHTNDPRQPELTLDVGIDPSTSPRCSRPVTEVFEGKELKAGVMILRGPLGATGLVTGLLFPLSHQPELTLGAPWRVRYFNENGELTYASTSIPGGALFWVYHRAARILLLTELAGAREAARVELTYPQHCVN